MKIDRVHFYTRDVPNTKDWFIRNVGFKAIDSSNIVDNNSHTLSEVIALHSVCLVLESPLTSSSPVARYLDSHPSGVADIVFRVEDLQIIIARARYLGLEVLQDIETVCLGQGEFKTAKIKGWGNLHHTLIETRESEPGYLSESDICNFNSHITDIDHIVLNVAAGKLKSAVQLYQNLFCFKIQQSFDIQTTTSGLYSQALIDDSGTVQFNINEPTSANSQIQEFIELNNGSGIQHLALRSQNLIADVEQMQNKEVEFLTIPQTYYSDRLHQLTSLSATEWQAIVKQQILIDSDSTNIPSLLMQIFTQPIFEQPTFFLEFIERRQQAKGFGQGNFKALFKAIEREQTKTQQ